MTIANASEQTVGYWQLLKQNPRFRRLWIAQLISSGGDWFNSVAVLGLVLQLTNSGLGASLVLLSSSIPSFFLIPIAGPVVDRFDRRKVMIIVNLIAMVLALLFLLVHDASTVWLIYVALILLIVCATFFGPASNASIPNIVTPDELFAANALSSASWGIMVMVGAALGGIISTLFGRNSAFIINSISFLVAALMIATIEIPSPRVEKAIHPWRDFVEGLSYLRTYKPSLSMVLVKTGWGIGAGALVLLSVFGDKVFHAGDAGIGFLYAARGFGALVGPLLVQRIIGKQIPRLRNSIWISMIVAGIGYLIFAASGWFGLLWLGCFALMFAHFGGGIVWIISSVLLQLTTPDRFRGRVFAVDYGLSTLTSGLATLVYGLALEAGVSPMILALIGAICFAVWGIIWGLLSTRGPLHISYDTVADKPDHLQ